MNNEKACLQRHQILGPKGRLFTQVFYSINGLAYLYLKEYVNDEDIEHVFEWVNNTVKHSLQFWNSLDGLQRSKDTKNAKRLDRAQVLTGWTSPKKLNPEWTFVVSKSPVATYRFLTAMRLERT